jgi:hypothetical protein
MTNKSEIYDHLKTQGSFYSYYNKRGLFNEIIYAVVK